MTGFALPHEGLRSHPGVRVWAWSGTQSQDRPRARNADVIAFRIAPLFIVDERLPDTSISGNGLHASLRLSSIREASPR
jgi:hypothetical protein